MTKREKAIELAQRRAFGDVGISSFHAEYISAWELYASCVSAVRQLLGYTTDMARVRGEAAALLACGWKPGDTVYRSVS